MGDYWGLRLFWTQQGLFLDWQMEVAVTVAGIIRQQACGLRVWCPEEEEEEEAATRINEPWRLMLSRSPFPPSASTRLRQGLQVLRQNYIHAMASQRWSSYLLRQACHVILLGSPWAALSGLPEPVQSMG